MPPFEALTSQADAALRTAVLMVLIAELSAEPIPDEVEVPNAAATAATMQAATITYSNDTTPS